MWKFIARTVILSSQLTGWPLGIWPTVTFINLIWIARYLPVFFCELFPLWWELKFIFPHFVSHRSIWVVWTTSYNLASHSCHGRTSRVAWRTSGSTTWTWSKMQGWNSPGSRSMAQSCLEFARWALEPAHSSSKVSSELHDVCISTSQIDPVIPFTFPTVDAHLRLYSPTSNRMRVNFDFRTYNRDGLLFTHALSDGGKVMVQPWL